MSKLVRHGECNHCGLCCKPPVIIEGPTIDKGEDRCKFYAEEANNKLYGHCLIYGRGKKPINAVNDRFGNKITKDQIRWFNDNCVDYPTVKDAKKGAKLLPECGFRFELTGL